MKEEIVIPIYFFKENGKIIIDEESIYDEMRNKIEEIKKNPHKFLEIKEYYCGSCGTTTADEKMNCFACGEWLGAEE